MEPNQRMPPTRGARLAWAEAILARAGSPSPRLDALVLLLHVTHTSQALLLAEPGHQLTPTEDARYASWVARRAAGEPVAYLTAHQAFMGLDLLVDHRVPLVGAATQGIVEAALEILRSRGAEADGLLLAEVSTGCGAIALALGTLEPRIGHIYAVDRSADALEVARANGARYLLNVLISWLEGEGPAALPEPVNLIIADLSSREGGDEAADHDALCELTTQAAERLRPGGALLLALDEARRTTLAALLAEVLPSAQVSFGAPRENGDSIVIAQLPR
jgi:release factor glutamine methyltransferase